jgi:hypothetical protein
VEHAGAEEDGADQDINKIEHWGVPWVPAILQSASNSEGRVWFGLGERQSA